MTKEKRNQTFPGQNCSFYFTAEQLSRGLIGQLAQGQTSLLWLWVVVTEVLWIPIQRSHILDSQQIVYKCIWQFQISSRAACVHRNSNTMEPVEMSMRKPDLEKRKPFAFCILHFYMSGFICFLFFFLVCVVPGVLSFHLFSLQQNI